MQNSTKVLPKLSREPQLANHLAAALEDQYERIRQVETDINPESAAFRRRWEKAFSTEAPIPQPQIDLLVVRDNTWLGIELKYIKYQRARKNRLVLPSYYEGIGQALALLRYGFDSVSLWHCFSSLIDRHDILYRADQTGALIQDLGLPIGYVTLIVEEEREEVNLRTAIVSHYPTELKIEDALPDPFSGTRTSPFRDRKEARRVREFIAQTRGILTV